jgi:hypothetical protein
MEGDVKKNSPPAFVPRYQTAGFHQPAEEPLDQPSSAVAPQPPAVLVLLGTRDLIWRDHVDAASLQLRIELVAVVRVVADQTQQATTDESLAEGFNDGRRLMARTTSP